MHNTLRSAAILVAFVIAVPVGGQATKTAAPDAQLTSPQRLDGGSNSGTATLIASNPYLDSGTTVGKGNNAALPTCLSGGSDTAEDAWYRVEFTEEVVLTTWTTCASGGPPSYDTRLGVFSSGLTLILCNDDAPDCGSPNYQSRISDLTLPAGTYYIVVDGYGGNEGPYQLNVTWVSTSCPGGSDSGNATLMTVFPFTDANTTVDACHNITIDCEQGPGSASPDRWYRMSLDTTVYVDTWITCDTLSINTRIAIFDSTLNLMFCNDDAPGCASNQSMLTDVFLWPGDYFIVVEDNGTTGGVFELHVDTTVVSADSSIALLPDIIVRESDLYDNDISTSVVPGRTHLRLSNGTANIGLGKLHIYGTGVSNGDGTENIMQRVFLPGGTFFDRTAGAFVFHPTHNHIHVDDWSAYRLREVLPGNGVGAEVAKGKKTSFCILDLDVYDSGLPNHNPSGQFFNCGSSTQGLSVGWVDIYSKGLPDQNIDITDVPAGTYWLESEVDPNNWFLESDETNNITRIKITLGGGPEINPDVYEPNDSIPAVDARPPGGNNSPNLGPCDPQRVLSGLTVHVAGNRDYFKFYSNHTGGAGDFVRIVFDSSAANLNLVLMDSTGAPVDSSVAASAGTETVSLNGKAEGWYYACVRSPGGDRIGAYALTVNPPSNSPPLVSPIDPPGGNTFILQGIDTYPVTWSASDPEGDATWVTVYANASPTLDGNEVLLPTSLHTMGTQGFFILNSAYLPVGSFWFYLSITDGGTTTGQWSSGMLTLLDPATAASGQRLATRLLPAYPNPFNPRTTLRFELAAAGQVQWQIYDVAGRLVHEIHNGALAAGTHSRTWDGTNLRGEAVASGIYFQRARTTGFVTTGKLVLLK